MTKTLPIGLTLSTPPPAAVDAGTQFVFSILPKWPQGVGPGGASYVLRTEGKPVYSGDLPWSEAEDSSIVFAVTAPENVGDHRFVLDVTAPKSDAHEAAAGSLAFVVKTIPHATSLAVWDVPSPVVRSTAFQIKAGAKCTSACLLAGKIVEVHDEDGKLMGSAALGDAVVVDTKGLYWTTVSLKAPRKLTLHSWTVAFAAAELKLAHGATTSRFSFVTVAEPAHSVSVKVVNKKTKAPVAGAQVRLGAYRAITNEKGSAKVRVPKGEFPLIVTRAGYEMPERSLQVSKDLRVQIGAEQLPEEDPFAAWTA